MGQAYMDFSGKFGAVFASIPAPIIAALYCLFFAYVGMFCEIMNHFFCCHTSEIKLMNLVLQRYA